LVFIIGKPENAAVRAAIRDCKPGCEVIAPPEASAWLQELLPGWQRERILVHTLSDAQHLPAIPAGAVRFLDPGVLSRLALPDYLREELVSGAQWSPTAAAFIDEQPVSFCYSGAETEAYWDVAIDTLPEHRRRGYAVQCAAFMIEHMRAQGKQPVWQAVEGNPASWKLAQKLGFAAVDELVLFTSPVAGSQPSTTGLKGLGH
jgi:GNAT superfamily N-acetyltransferase